MEKIYDVVIIGGGASGLACANFLETSKIKTLIIDKSSLGKKLLVTGNGRCNLTNKNMSIDKFNTTLVKDIIEDFNQYDTIKFFRSIGIECFFDDEGRAYPLSESAKDVKYALTKNLSFVENVQAEVLRVEKNDVFQITLDSQETIKSKKVVVACGNKNLKDMLKFDLPFEKEKQALAGFYVKGFDKNLMGLRENAVVKAKELDFLEKGQVQFRKDGISGIVIFNLSAKFMDKPFVAEIELLPEIEQKEIEGVLRFRKQHCKNLKVADLLLGILKPELAKYILKISKIKNLDRHLEEISKAEIEEVVKNIKSLKFLCEKTYEDGQVLAGGVHLKNLKNLESSIKDLYFCGESACVYGVCGGYNLQWAFSSGRYVAKMINSKS